jgi:hypothetical protein
LVGGLPGDAEPGADLGPGVPAAAQALDCLGDGGVQLVCEAGHEDECSHVVDRWSAGKAAGAWLFDAPEGGPLRESNWKRSVGWRAATVAAGLAGFRVHDLRHTAASAWLGAGADPKVVQRVLGHATASMTVDLYGHLVDANLWQAARLVGDISGTFEPPGPPDEEDGKAEADGNAW